MDRKAGSPGIIVPLAIVALSLAVRFVPGWVAPQTMAHFMGMGLGPVIGLVGLVLWWLFARRVSWRDRLLGTGAGIAVVVLALVVAHPSTTGVLIMHGLVVAVALVAGVLVATRSMSWSVRRFILAGCLALGLLPWAAFRVDGQGGSLAFELSPRWSTTAEQRFLEGRSGSGVATPTAEPGAMTGVVADWPGFRGPLQDGIVLGVSFDTDWATNPPKELWRHKVGPAWSSFAVAGGVAFTQEQRGEDEVVVAYSLANGSERWVHASRERFEEPQGGPGPRATPAYRDGALYTLGASGTLTALDAATGSEKWSRNLVADVGAPIPPWGFSGSPVVHGRAVIVFAGADAGRGLVAYDRESGEMLWTAGAGQFSYSTPVLAEIGGEPQLLIATDLGLEAVAPDDGAALWRHDWPLSQMPRIVVPIVVDDGRSVMLPTGYGKGTRRIELISTAEGYTTKTTWESRALKPYFNDAICHEGFCYGFDGRIFTCIGAADGERRWKGGRYGNGQVVLLPEIDTLLVITDDGELVLVAADPTGHRELARLQALSGKTWNHPVIVDGKLLVRNDEEVACYELPDAVTTAPVARLEGER